MNATNTTTKSVAAAPVAPTTAETNKLNVEQLTEMLNNLRKQELDLEEKDVPANQKQQAELIKKIREIKSTRISELTKISKAIKDFKFSVKELFAESAISHFSDDEILAEVKNRKIGSKPKATKKSIAYESEKNPVLLTAPRIDSDHHKTIDTILHRGRVYENPFAVSTPLLREAGKDIAETVKNLLNRVDKSSLDYVKTDAGKAELEKLAKLIMNAKKKTAEKAA